MSHPQIQRMVADDIVVRVFYRTSDRTPFVYHGIAKVLDLKDETPVKVIWDFGSGGEGQRRQEQLPEEVDPNTRYIEGATKVITVNAYERNPAARRACIAHYGASCQACGMDFGDVYGDAAAGYIHVHLVTPLSEITGEREIDPIADMIPVCPNCHAILHRSPHPTVEHLRDIVAQRRS